MKLLFAKILNNKFLLLAVFLFVINLSLVFYYYSLKTGTHIDENFSYAHANSSQGAFLSEKINSYFNDSDFEVRNKWLKGNIFNEYMTVQKDEAFRYGHIWENIKNDVHPPFYYILLHTICSFFIDSYSKWYGAGLNVIIWIFLLFSLYKLSNLVLKDKYLSLITVCLYAFSQIGFNTVLFIRMYALQTLFAVLLVFDTLKLVIKEDKFSLFKIFIWSFLGVFTQYSSLAFSFIVCFITSIVFLCKKNWYLCAYYILSMSLSVSLLFILFPSAFEVLLFSQRGAELIDYLNDMEIVWKRLQNIFNVCTIYLLSFSSNKYRFCILLFVSLFFIFKIKDKNCDILVLIILFITTLFEFYLSYTMPLNYATGTRYQMPIMPLYAFLFVYMTSYFLVKLKFNKAIIYVILAVGIFINSVKADFGNKSSFRFQNDENTNKFLQDVRNKKVIIVSAQFWTLFEHLGYLMYVDKVYSSFFPCDYPLRKMMRKQEKGTYFVYFNIDAVKTNNDMPNKNKDVCANLGENLDFLYTVSLGERFYDVYMIK